MAILVVTRRVDPTADLVVEELNRRHLPVVRFDPGDVPGQTDLSVQIGADGVWRGYLATRERKVLLEEIRVVYCRRPSPVVSPAPSIEVKNFVEGEAKAGIWGLLYALDAEWVNHPHANSLAGRKPVQLTMAARCGLHVAPTLVTNSTASAERFTSDRKAVYKQMGPPPFTAVEGKLKALYTTPIGSQSLSGVEATLHLFQERLRKAYEVRLTVVEKQMFAARIMAGSPRAQEDFRADYESLSYEVCEIPPTVARGVRRMMETFGLSYGALDFVVNDQGWWFLEINPNGQWGWIQNETGMPIASALADLLEEKWRQPHTISTQNERESCVNSL